jgi:hypothetical protein
MMKKACSSGHRKDLNTDPAVLLAPVGELHETLEWDQKYYKSSTRLPVAKGQLTRNMPFMKLLAFVVLERL